MFLCALVMSPRCPTVFDHLPTFLAPPLLTRPLELRQGDGAAAVLVQHLQGPLEGPKVLLRPGFEAPQQLEGRRVVGLEADEASSLRVHVPERKKRAIYEDLSGLWKLRKMAFILNTKIKYSIIIA